MEKELKYFVSFKYSDEPSIFSETQELSYREAKKLELFLHSHNIVARILFNKATKSFAI